MASCRAPVQQPLTCSRVPARRRCHFRLFLTGARVDIGVGHGGVRRCHAAASRVWRCCGGACAARTPRGRSSQAQSSSCTIGINRRHIGSAPSGALACGRYVASPRNSGPGIGVCSFAGTRKESGRDEPVVRRLFRPESRFGWSPGHRFDQRRRNCFWTSPRYRARPSSPAWPVRLPSCRWHGRKVRQRVGGCRNCLPRIYPMMERCRAQANRSGWLESANRRCRASGSLVATKR